MKGVLLVNLGTPSAPTPAAVAAYLTEFLSDPRVVDLPRWLWLPLLKLVIIPLRRNRSAEAYKKVWTPDGSPLLLESEKLASKLQESLGDEVRVQLAMRYGQPDIHSGLKALRKAGVEQLVVLPMYPQYSGTTTEAVFRPGHSQTQGDGMVSRAFIHPEVSRCARVGRGSGGFDQGISAQGR